MTREEAIEFFRNFSKSSTEDIILLGTPLIILAILILVYTLVVILKNRRDKANLEKLMELEELPEVVEQKPTSAKLDSLPKVERPNLKEPVSVSPVKPVSEAPAQPSEVEEIRSSDRQSWLVRLRGGLAKTRDTFRASVGGIFTKEIKIDDDVLERLHEALYRADIGVKTADKLVSHLRNNLEKNSPTDWQTVANHLKNRATTLLEQPNRSLNKPAEGPWVILVIGVNGVGKTTSIGKLAAHFLAQNKKVLLCAADTFRAAAIDQLQVWGDRLGVEVIKHKQGSDPAAVTFDAVKAAKARQVDVLLIDTAGRLHNKTELMQELDKINRVIGKDLPGAPHETWLVIDATTGQNAVMQVKAFREVVDVSGLVVTKLDGTAKGGVLIGIVDQFSLPIRYVGVGEKAVDLRDFTPGDYVESLF